MRRRALIAGLVALALLAAPASALATDQVVVEAEGGSPVTLNLSALGDPDVQGREYAVGEQRMAITGHSLDRVLDRANVDPFEYGDIEVLAAGSAVSFDREEVVRQGAFPDGPPVFWMQDGTSRFLRPGSAAGGPALIGGAGPVTVRLSLPSRLRVSATASSRRVDPGERVTFTATVEGADDGEPVDVSWYFDDGRRASGLRVTHRFRERGTYDVVVGARTSGDDPGDDEIVTVQVGPERRGPNRKGGGTNRAAGAPDSGVGTGPGGSGSGGGGSAGGSSTGGPGGSAGAPDGSAPDSAAARDAAASRRTADRRAARRRAEARREREAAEREPAFEPVESGGSRQVRGIELADLSALSSDAGRDALHAARRGQLRDEDSGGGVPPAVWWSLGTAALLGLGGWREARSRPAARAT